MESQMHGQGSLTIILNGRVYRIKMRINLLLSFLNVGILVTWN
jgi:hypothetical protein